MKKILFSIVFVIALFALKSVFASESFAASVSGNFDNRAGSIDITVNYTIKDQVGSNPVTGSVTVGHGSAANAVYPFSVTNFTTSDFPSITWFTSCNLGSDSTSGTGGVYTFTDQDVHCKTPNSSITINSTNCTSGDGQINWTVTSGSGGANIAYFNIYKSLGGNPDSDTSPLSVTYVSGTNSYSLPNGTLPNALKTLANGTWTLRVKAFTNAPDNNSVFTDGQFTCPGSFAPPSNLITNINCVTSSPLSYRVDFSWSPAESGSYAYRVEIATSSSGPWGTTYYDPVPNTNTYYSVSSGFSAGTQYWWRVKATQSVTLTVNYSNVANFTTPSSCPANVPAAGLSLTFCERGGFGALPNDVTFRWTRATPTASIQAENLEYSTNSNFPPDGSTISTAVPGGYYDPNPDINFVAGTRYYWRINTKMSDNIWYPSPMREFEALYQCDYDISGTYPVTLYGYATCVDGYQYIRLYWQGGNYGYDIFYDSGGGLYYFGVHTSAAFYNPPFTNWPATTRWRVQVSLGSIYYSNIVTISSINCGSAPGAPSNLQAVATSPSVIIGCNTSNLPSIDLKFNDNSSSETSYALEISKEPFTGSGSTNPSNMWGVKSLPPNTTTFTWSAASPLAWANANPGALPGSELVPIEETTYYWRVKTMSNGGQSNYMYPDGTVNSTIYPAGLPFRIPLCTQGYDLKVSMVAGSARKFATQEATNIFSTGDLVNVDFKVENIKSSQLASNATNLYFYYKSAGVPSCTGTAVANPVPPDGKIPPFPQDYTPVPAIPLGGSTTVTVTFGVGYVAGTFTGAAYVIPGCAIAAGLTEYDWSNNNSSNSGGPRFTYKIGALTFFQTQGGDVGAKGTIAAGLDGSCVGYYQSDYGITGGSVNTYIKGKSNGSGANFTANVVSGGVESYTVVSRGGGYLGSSVDVVIEGGGGSGAKATANMLGNVVWTVTKDNAGSGYTSTPTVKFCPSGPAFKAASYNKPLVPAGGVYNYFASKFRNKATTSQCSISSGAYSGYYYCATDMTITGATTMTLTGNSVFFIDGNLRIDANIAASGAASVVFVVKGNIVVNRNTGGSFITSLDGIYIARKGFADTDAEFGNDSWLFGSGTGLTINGGLYVDAEEGAKVNLLRYWNNSLNSTQPSDIFKFDPKYLIILRDLLGSPAIGWKEVAP